MPPDKPPPKEADFVIAQIPTSPVHTELEKKRFLEKYQDTASVVDACHTLGLPKDTVYSWRRTDKAFAKQWDEITRYKLTPHFEEAAIRRALDGDNLMLIFLLKAYGRDIYDEKAVGLKPDKKINIQIRGITGKALLKRGEPVFEGKVPREERVVTGRELRPSTSSTETGGE